MIITIVGLHGPLTNLCRDICLALLRHAGRTPLADDVDTLAGLARHALAAAQGTLVMTATRPEPAFLDAVRDADRPFLLVLDDPRRAVLHRVEDGGLRARDAIIEIGTSCACLTEVLSFPRAVRVTGEALGADPSGFVAHLLSVLDLPSDDPDLIEAGRQVMQRAHAAGLPAADATDAADRLESALGPVWGLAAKAALSAYEPAFSGGRLGRLIAARDMFQLGDADDAMVTGTIDVTGRPRILAYGPYMRIPRGQWTLRMTLGFSAELVDTPFSLDIVCFESRVRTELGRVSFTAISGRYVAQTNFAHDEPSLGLEFRLFVDRATFDGKVAIGFAELERMEDQAPPDLARLMDWQDVG